MAEVARVVLADTHGLFRVALGVLVAQQPGLEVVGDCSEVAGLASLVATHDADVVLLDGELASAASPTLIEEVKEASNRRVCVLVIDHEPSEHRLVGFVESGADGYLTRLDEVDELYAAVDAVLGGHAHIPTEMLGGLLRSLIHQRRERDAVVRRFESLTKRETEILVHLCDGLGGEEIGERLYISAATVRTHVQNVLRKLDVHSQVEAAALVRRHGLLDERLGLAP